MTVPHQLMNFFIGKRTAIIAATTAMITVAAAAAYRAYRKRKQEARRNQAQAAFENRYFKEYDELADDPDAPVPSRNRHVRETTPQGDVIMAYDAAQQVFCYYCDTRSVQFKYLESVARKYVIEHGCKRLYIDFREDLTRAKNNAVAVKPPSVFAQLKKYSTSKHINNKFKMPTASALKHVTRYLYCGRLSDFSADSDTEDAHDFNVIKPIDYASYKKLRAT